MSQKLKRKNSKGIKIWVSWVFLLALFCFFNVPTAQSENTLNDKFLRAWIKGNGKQINVHNGKLQVAKLKKKDNVMNVMLVAFDCDADDTDADGDSTPNDCDGYCYDIINLKSVSGDCEEEKIGELYTCGSDEKTGSAIISKFDDPEDFEAAIITKQVFKNDGTLKKLESKAGIGKIDDVDTLYIEPDYVFKNLLLKATEITEEELDCTPQQPE
jgi:hypothetical protein